MKPSEGFVIATQYSVPVNLEFGDLKSVDMEAVLKALRHYERWSMSRPSVKDFYNQVKCACKLHKGT